jgi:hypothetical protein
MYLRFFCGIVGEAGNRFCNHVTFFVFSVILMTIKIMYYVRRSVLALLCVFVLSYSRCVNSALGTVGRIMS